MGWSDAARAAAAKARAQKKARGARPYEKIVRVSDINRVSPRDARVFNALTSRRTALARSILKKKGGY